MMILKTPTQKSLQSPKLPAEIARNVKSVIEKYPRIGNRIVLLWGSAALQKYMSNLIMDEKGHSEGFPPLIAAAIRQIHKAHGNLVTAEDKGNWNMVLD